MENSKPFTLPVVLNGNNYLLWSRITKTALCGRGLWNQVMETEALTTTREDGGQEVAIVDEGKRFQDDQAVLAILQNSLDRPILEAYSYCENAKELWQTLKNVYGNISNLSRIFEVKRALNKLNQEDDPFTKHFGKFRALLAELEMLRPSTNDPALLNERREQDNVFRLLLTLKPAFKELIRHILRADKLPTLDEVCMLIQKEEGSIGLFEKDELITANKSRYKPEDKKLWCDRCKRKGHNKDTCWILHPHLKPKFFNNPRAHWSKEAAPMGDQRNIGSSSNKPTPMEVEAGHAHTANTQGPDKLDRIESLIKTLTELKESGNAYLTYTLPKALVVDSGASHHMISDPSLIHNIEPVIGNVIIANGDKVPIKGIGELRVLDKRSKAFYVPKFASNLLSVKRATNDLNCYAIFGPNSVVFQDIRTGATLGKGVSKDGLYVLEDTKNSSNLSLICNSVVASNDSTIWHARLGHPHSRALELMLPSIKYDNIDCEACILGKHCRSVFTKSSTKYEKCFELIHSDVWSSPCASRDNLKYFVTFIDEKSKYTWLTLLPSKDRVLDAFVNFQNYITNQYHCKVKILRSDNGGEYTSQAFKQHLTKHGIMHQTTCPYTPQQNGVAERKNRHLMEVARSLMFHTNVPKRFWSDAVMTACYLINRTPTKILDDQSPFEVLNNTKPYLDHLRIFGCVCFVLVPRELRSKLEAKSTKCMFLGYSSTQKGYKCYNPETRKVVTSRDVKFIESKGFFEERNWNDLKDLHLSTSNQAESLKFILENLGNDHSRKKPTAGPSGHVPQDDSSCTAGQLGHIPQDGSSRTAGQLGHVPQDGNSRTAEQSGHVPQDDSSRTAEQSGHVPQDSSYHTADRPRHVPRDEDSRTAGRTRCIPRDDHYRTTEQTDHVPRDDDPRTKLTLPTAHLQTTVHDARPYDSNPVSEYVSDDDKFSDEGIQELTPLEPAPLRRSQRIRKEPSNWINTRVYYNNQAVAHPIQAVCSLANFPLDYQTFLGKLDQGEIPRNYEEAREHQVWLDAVNEESEAMKRNHTWDESDLPTGKKAVSSRWIFTIKYKSNGDIERYKARLVARGFTQTYGEDYLDTFAPVAKLNTVRVIMSLATNLEWEMWQMDVKNAFLQGELEDEVYMTPPPGLENEVSPGKVLRLKKAIYGLKQSPRAWYHKLSTTLQTRGFIKSQADHTLFTLQSHAGIIVILIYVDDIIISGNDKEGIHSTKSFLNSVFDMKDLGELKYFLGIEVFRSSDGLFLSQRKYTIDLLSEAGQLGAKPAATPIEDPYRATQKGEHADEPFEDITQYRRMVGKLIYLTLTRPDICFAVNRASQHMQAPKVQHWHMVTRILKYLKGSPGKGIWMGRNGSSEIVGYCDADWAGDRMDRRSTTGYCTFIGGNLVTWKSKKQKVVACSSAEAEYRAMRKLTDELIWLKAVLKDLGIESHEPITMHCDNQAAIHIASNSVFHERTKHIEVDCHKVREKVEEGIILPCYTKSSDQLADVFTKAASYKVCEFIHPKLGLLNIMRP